MHAYSEEATAHIDYATTLQTEMEDAIGNDSVDDGAKGKV